jgi:hypothetical protein
MASFRVVLFDCNLAPMNFVTHLVASVNNNPQVAAAAIAALVAAGTSLYVALASRRAARNLETARAEFTEGLNKLSDRLERDRVFAEFQRNRIHWHLDQLFAAYLEIQATIQLVQLPTWLKSADDLAAEQRFRAAAARVEFHLLSLAAYQAIEESTRWSAGTALGGAQVAWHRMLGEANRRTPGYHDEYPDEREFSRELFQKAWEDLATNTATLGKLLASLPATVVLPK